MSTLKPELELLDTEMARIACYGLVVGCPFDYNKGDCQFSELRKNSLESRIQWVRDLTDQDCLKHYQIHCNCKHNLDSKIF